MLMDNNLNLSKAQAITSTALSTNAIDLRTGIAIGSAGAFTNPADIIGNASQFGEDFGIGTTAGVPRVVGEAIAAFTAAGAATLQVQFQGLVDSGLSLTLSGATWVTYGQTDTIAKTLLTANTRIFSFDWPMRKIGQSLPRFVVLNYVVATGPFTAGTITADITMGGADDAVGTLQQYPANFTVAA